jgi:hypothetical protein
MSERIRSYEPQIIAHARDCIRPASDLAEEWHRSQASTRRKACWALAIVGIVLVKVWTENGAIRPGNLLVASSTPDHAMKAGPNPPLGTVIGKALGKLDRGTGIIKMLVTLQ